jgi:hypothetical protein
MRLKSVNPIDPGRFRGKIADGFRGIARKSLIGPGNFMVEAELAYVHTDGYDREEIDAMVD